MQDCTDAQAGTTEKPLPGIDPTKAQLSSGLELFFHYKYCQPGRWSLHVMKLLDLEKESRATSVCPVITVFLSQDELEVQKSC